MPGDHKGIKIATVALARRKSAKRSICLANHQERNVAFCLNLHQNNMC